MSELRVDEHFPSNGQGWRLHIARWSLPDRPPAPGSRPVVLVPGYGMNAFVLGWHPQGTSMVRALALGGLEVWTAELRHQGASRPSRRRPEPPSMRGYALEDLPAVVDRVLRETRTGADRVDLVGSSLGGSVVYAHLALAPAPRVGAVVAIGAPLRWPTVPPLFRAAFASRRLAAALPMSGVRHLARAAFPALVRLPWALSVYVNAAHVDPARAVELTESVDDPHPAINAEMADWLRERDLRIDGRSVSAALGAVDRPLLVVLANRDGIVPPDAATSVLDAWGGRDVEVLRVGTEADWYAHADLFIAPEAPARVFAPMVAFLRARQGS